MKLEDQCVSLEMAKKLKELGVNKISLFYWNICHDCENEYPEGSVQWELVYGENHGENISAFTVAELGEILPASRGNSYRDESGWYMNMILPVSEWKKYYPCVTEAS